MQTKEYRTVDKSKWGPGPWQNEPDKMQWTDKSTSLPCLIVRSWSGALCGYVGVAEGHRLYGKGYSSDALDEVEIDVHGGLTFADACADGVDESRRICHVPDPGEPDHVWWFGFDCAHYLDFCPALKADDLFNDGHYRDVLYVRAQVEGLARQLAAIL